MLASEVKCQCPLEEQLCFTLLMSFQYYVTNFQYHSQFLNQEKGALTDVLTDYDE